MTFIKNHFTSGSKIAKFRNVLAKSNTEPQNSTDEQLANSTPQACFFIRSIRSPKENVKPSNRLGVLLSMVACNGKGFALCCVPIVAVSEPVTRYRPSLRTLAVTSIQTTIGAIPMIYLFQCVRRTEADYRYHKIYIQADSEQNARFQLHADYRPMPERPIARFQHFPTACLQAAEVVYAC